MVKKPSQGISVLHFHQVRHIQIKNSNSIDSNSSKIATAPVKQQRVTANVIDEIKNRITAGQKTNGKQVDLSSCELNRVPKVKKNTNYKPQKNTTESTPTKILYRLSWILSKNL